MTSSDTCDKSAWYGKSPFLLTMLFLCTTAALASGPGPNGVNIGFDFNWNNGPQGYTASFIANTSGSGATLDNCAVGLLTATSSACDFVFAYSIGGVAQTPVVSGGTYETYPTLPAAPQCNVNPGQSAPLTLFNCFNSNSFGQVFRASATGPLTAYSMNLTCLNPAGTPLTGLNAVIYQVNPNGTSIPALPLGSVPLDLSTCPTLTSWSGHAFSSGDFAAIPMNFSSVALTAGNFYAVYFSGLVPGAGLPGSPTVTSVTPATGPLTGGNTVTIAGTGFTGATSVTFGGVAATSFSVVSNTAITAVVPSNTTAGAVSVIVTNGTGSNAANTLYSYLVATPAPTVTSVTPATGLPTGGNTVTIAGTGFTGATSVTFGGVAATSFSVVSNTAITAVVPSSASTGPVSVIVTSGGGSNAANTLYSYLVGTPTLSQWGMIGFAGLLVLFAISKLRNFDRYAKA